MRSKKLNNEDLHRPRIGIDLMGCDTPPQELLRALIDAQFDETHPPKFTFFATKEIFDLVPTPSDFNCHIVDEVINPEDAPLSAVKNKKNSPTMQGMHLLKSFDLDVLISAGNTGALLAAAKLTLPMLPGISRPALMTLIPTKREPVAVLDVGANVNVKAENLLQFAQMGIAYQKTRGIAHPTVGLLNIGEEKQKGTPEHQKAYQMLGTLNEDAPIEHPVFVGNMEGRNVFHGDIDVLITDGFTGNVFLKTSEGIAGFILDQMETLGPIGSLPGLKSIMESLRYSLRYYEYPGAIFCGVDGIIIKCHGESPPEAFINSIKSSSRLVQHFFLEKIKKELTEI